jgi:hypothetical protein
MTGNKGGTSLQCMRVTRTGVKLISKFMNEGGVKKNQLDAQLILSIFCQSLHVSGIYRPIIRRFTTVCIQQLVPTRATDSHLKTIISIKCCIHTVVPPDDGPRYARNM